MLKCFKLNKQLSDTSYWKPISSTNISRCGTHRWSWRLNALEHNVHAYFRSSLCINLCLANALELLNVFWHIRHWIIDRLPELADADEPTPALTVRGLFRCMPLGFVADGDNVSLRLSKSSLLPNHKTKCTNWTYNYTYVCQHTIPFCTLQFYKLCRRKFTKNVTISSSNKCWPQWVPIWML